MFLSPMMAAKKTDILNPITDSSYKALIGKQHENCFKYIERLKIQSNGSYIESGIKIDANGTFSLTANNTWPTSILDYTYASIKWKKIGDLGNSGISFVSNSVSSDFRDGSYDEKIYNIKMINTNTAILKTPYGTIEMYGTDQSKITFTATNMIASILIISIVFIPTKLESVKITKNETSLLKLNDNSDNIFTNIQQVVVGNGPSSYDIPVFFNNKWYGFMISSGFYTTLYTSTDGIRWKANSKFIDVYGGQCYLINNILIIKGSAALYATLDGKIFTELDVWDSFIPQYLNNKYYAVKNTSNWSKTLCYSDDGITYTDIGIFGSDLNLSFANNKYFLHDRSSLKIYYSIDGITFNLLMNLNDYPELSATTSSTISFEYIANKWIMKFNDSSHTLKYCLDDIFNIDKTEFTTTIIDSDLSNGKILFTDFINNKFISIGTTDINGNGTKYLTYSTDGVNWSSKVALPSPCKHNAIAFGNNKYVTVGGNGYYDIAYSMDLTNWTTAKLLPSNVSISPTPNWFYVVYANNMFVTWSSSNYYAYSTDGINWTYGQVNYSISPKALLYASGKFVVLCSNQVVYSTDGINWTVKLNITSGYSFTHMCYGNNMFVAIGSCIATSTNGIDWTVVSTNSFNGKISYGGGKFLIGMNGKVMHSIDLTNWTTNSLEWDYNSTIYDCRGVCYGNNVFFITNGWANYGHLIILSLGDNINWVDSNLPINSYTYKKINSRLYAYNSSSIYYTTDGMAFTKVLSATGLGVLQILNNAYYILYKNGVYRSTDGITFSSITLTNPAVIVYHNGIYVVTESTTSSRYSYSFDGINFTRATTAINARTTADYCNGIWIFGGNGKLFVTKDITFEEL